MKHWAFDAFFYHIYPLGLCGAPFHNDYSSTPQGRLERLYSWMDHMQYLGVNAVYLGPLFESSTHGYDTVDYFKVDRRLGDQHLLTDIVKEYHRRGIRVIFDAVFNHVGRDFWAFQDVLQYGEQSIYKDWFYINFQERSFFGDPFSYLGWNGFYELVKLNLQNQHVKEHLLSAVTSWIREFNIDGIRLDAADCLDMSFNRELAATCRSLQPDFYMVAEIIHGDYRNWANHEMFDAVTNYECYKGLFSSHNDRNYFEIAWSLNRQFGENGLYRELPLYNFADNHDVNRLASQIDIPAHVYPLYCLLFTMPGTPSIYYGSEWGVEGVKEPGSDSPLRPELDIKQAPWQSRHADLVHTINRLAHIRKDVPALRQGNYRQLFVAHEQLAFAREMNDETVLVIINSSSLAEPVEFDVPDNVSGRFMDVLNHGSVFEIQNGHWKGNVDGNWGRILVRLNE